MPTTAPPVSTTRAIATATVVASVIAIIVNAIVSLVAQALGADPAVFRGLVPGAYILFTVVGVLIGAIGWHIIRTRAARPSALLRWLVPTVVVVSLIPNVLVGISVGWLGASALGLMHIVVAAVAVPVYRRFLPLPR